MDWFKLKVFANEISDVIKMIGFAWERAKRIVNREQNTGNQHFLFFPNLVKKLLSMDC